MHSEGNNNPYFKQTKTFSNEHLQRNTSQQPNENTKPR